MNLNHKHTLQKIIAPISISDYFENYFEKNHLYIPRNDAHYFDEMISIDDIDLIFQQKILPQKALRVANVKKNQDHRKAPVLTNASTTALDNEAILGDFATNGTSMVLSATQNYLPKVNLLVSRLESEFNFKVSVNIYIAPPQAQAFHPHYDLHDLFLLQIFGHKTWYIFDSIAHLPDHQMSKIPSVPKEKFTKESCQNIIEIQPGDTLYMPRGMVHCVVSTDTPSIHLAIGLHQPKGYDVLDGLKMLATQRKKFRTGLQRFLSKEEQLIELEEVKKELIEWIATTSNEELLQLLDKSFDKERNHHHQNRFKDILLKDNINELTEFKLKAGLTYQLNGKSPMYMLQFETVQKPIPMFLKEMIDYIGKGNIFSVKDLPSSIPIVKKLALLKNLIKDGFITIIDLNK